MPHGTRTLCISILLLVPTLTVAQPNKPGGGKPPGAGAGGKGGNGGLVQPPLGPGGAKPGAPGGKMPDGIAMPDAGGNFVVPKHVAGKDFDYWKRMVNPEHNKDAYVRQLAVRALAEFGPQEFKKVASLVVERLRDIEDPTVRFAALQVLCAHTIEDPKVKDRAVQLIFGQEGMINSNNEMLRLAASNSAAHIGPQAAVAIPILLGEKHLLNMNSYEARQAAAAALGQVARPDPTKFLSTSTAGPPGPDSRAIRALVARLGDPCLTVRIEVAHSLMLLGKPSEERDLQVERLGLLDRIGREGKKGLETDATLKLWLRMGLIRLADVVTDKDLDPIVESLRSDDGLERVNAAQAIGILGADAKSKAGALRQGLQPKFVNSDDPNDQDFVFHCLWAIGRMGNEASILQKEVELLKDHKIPQLKAMALDTLDRLKVPPRP